MRTKTIFILSLLLFSGVCTVSSYGQQAIESLIPKIERISESPPKANTIEVNVSQERRQGDGTVVMLHKQFTINNYPNLVKELIQAFNKEKGNVQSLTESLKNGVVFRRYIFRKDDRTTTCLLSGTENKMTFQYIQALGETRQHVSATGPFTTDQDAERFFSGLPRE